MCTVIGMYDYWPGKVSQAIISERGRKRKIAFENISDQGIYLKKI